MDELRVSANAASLATGSQPKSATEQTLPSGRMGIPRGYPKISGIPILFVQSFTEQL